MPRHAKLLFDSARAGAVVGTRSLGIDERSLLFAAGRISLDVLLLPSGGGLEVAYGQVVDAVHERPLEGAQVRIASDGPSAETDHFGQFCLSSLEPMAGRVLQIEAAGEALACAVPALPAAAGGAR